MHRIMTSYNSKFYLDDRIVAAAYAAELGQDSHPFEEKVDWGAEIVLDIPFPENCYLVHPFASLEDCHAPAAVHQIGEGHCHGHHHWRQRHWIVRNYQTSIYINCNRVFHLHQPINIAKKIVRFILFFFSQKGGARTTSKDRFLEVHQIFLHRYLPV